MRVGASRPRQTSQGDDKDKNMNSEEGAVDNGAGGKDGETGNNNQRNAENEDDEQESG